MDFYLNNDPLHYSQKVKDWHHTAKEHYDGQSLEIFGYHMQWVIKMCSYQASIYDELVFTYGTVC